VGLGHGATPVFTDDSGRRAKVLQWVVRGFCGLLTVAGGAVVLSLVLHVPLPGLDHPLVFPWGDQPDGAGSGVTSEDVGSARTRGDASDPSSASYSAGTGGTVRNAVVDLLAPEGTAGTKAVPSMKSSSTPNAHSAGSPNAHSSAGTPNAHSSAGTPNAHSSAGTPNVHSSVGTPNAHSTSPATRRAVPTQAPGSPPATPPGKTK